jgi:hypothetical protein
MSKLKLPSTRFAIVSGGRGEPAAGSPSGASRVRGTAAEAAAGRHLAPEIKRLIEALAIDIVERENRQRVVEAVSQKQTSNAGR